MSIIFFSSTGLINKGFVNNIMLMLNLRCIIWWAMI